MDYPFANGVVKAIESQLLDRVKYAKLAKAASRQEFLAILAGFGRGDQAAIKGRLRTPRRPVHRYKILRMIHI